MNTKGFTLIEIIIVLVLLGVLAMIAVPKYLNLVETAEIQAAKGTLAEVQARLNQTFMDWLLKGIKPELNDKDSDGNKIRKGSAVSTLLPMSCMEKIGKKSYKYGLADEGTNPQCKADNGVGGTIGGWMVEMQAGNFIHFCEPDKRDYKVKRLTSPRGKKIDFTTDTSSGDTIGAQKYADEFILYTPECPAYMSPK